MITGKPKGRMIDQGAMGLANGDPWTAVRIEGGLFSVVEADPTARLLRSTDLKTSGAVVEAVCLHAATASLMGEEHLRE